MGAGGFPIDLVLFGMIAAFLVLRLRGILGKRTGFEPTQGPARPVTRPVGTVIDAVAEPPSAPTRKLPDPTGAVGQALVRMAKVDTAFDPERFLTGAEAAFVLIVTKFAAGDRAALRPLLSAETFATFDAAITAREAAGETQTSEVRSIQEATAISRPATRPGGCCRRVRRKRAQIAPSGAGRTPGILSVDLFELRERPDAFDLLRRLPGDPAHPGCRQRRRGGDLTAV
jgi:hypothetical protein